MRKFALAAGFALALTFVLTIGTAQAGEVEVSCASLGMTLPPGQRPEGSPGAHCTTEVSVDNISREIGGGSRCQDATITTTIDRMYNKNGGLMDSRTVTSEPVESDWGPSYAKPAGGCNYSD